MMSIVYGTIQQLAFLSMFLLPFHLRITSIVDRQCGYGGSQGEQNDFREKLVLHKEENVC